ncbi:MAG: hypothetical protein EA356_03665 [Geminicoccaceae bacterium]|nr:MAG: hypothetical protein EA356_03665 [Geminicoccaceae bacterium]
MNTGFAIRHLGRRSEATGKGKAAGVGRLRSALLAMGFHQTVDQAEHLEFRRRPYLLQDDWPMQVTVRTSGRDVKVTYGAFIPWPWILGFVASIVVVLPFAGILRADLIFVAAALAAALAVLNREFDCRPNATYWQKASRRRWGEALEAAIDQAFARETRS